MQSSSIDVLPDILGEEINFRNDGSVEKVQDSGKNLKNLLPENCAVCGNRAIGYHYDVPSCNGCKAFFRRTIITGNRVSCKKSNKCMERKKQTSRRLCPGCRFSKCEDVGMNPMNIRAEITENGKTLKEQFMANRESNMIVPCTFMTLDNYLNTTMSKLTLVEGRLESLMNSGLPTSYGDLRSLSEVLQMNPILESSKIPNLKLLSNELFPVRAGFVHNTCLAVVEFSKIFESFSQISHGSALKLIRHGGLMCGGLMVCRRSIQKFNSDALRHPDGELAGKPDRSWNGVWVEHKAMIHKVLFSFLRNKLNDVEFLFLKAIAMCNPAVPDLPDHDRTIVEKERFGYARNFLNYCLKKHGNIHGPDRFSAVLSMISIMESQQKEEKCFYIILRAYFSDADLLVSPLYDEIMAS